MNIHEILLPPDVLSCAEKHGNEYCWHVRDFIRVADAAEKTGLASYGWRIIFRSPDGVSEICWHHSPTNHRLANEAWRQYVRRSWIETRRRWQELFETKSRIDEGRRIIKFMQETEDDLIFPHNVIWFVLDFESEQLNNSPSLKLRTPDKPSKVMLERRRFQRVRLTARCMLNHNGTIYKGQLENISLNGALVRFEQAVVLPVGHYIFAVYIEDNHVPFQFMIKIVCTSNLLTGLSFVSCEVDTEIRLSRLLEKLTLEPDMRGTDQRKYGNV